MYVGLVGEHETAMTFSDPVVKKKEQRATPFQRKSIRIFDDNTPCLSVAEMVSTVEESLLRFPPLDSMPC